MQHFTIALAEGKNTINTRIFLTKPFGKRAEWKASEQIHLCDPHMLSKYSRASIMLWISGVGNNTMKSIYRELELHTKISAEVLDWSAV